MSGFAPDRDVAGRLSAGLVLAVASLVILALVLALLWATVDRWTSPARVPVAIGGKWHLRAETQP